MIHFENGEIISMFVVYLTKVSQVKIHKRDLT